VAACTQEALVHDFKLTIGLDWSEAHIDACAVDASGNHVSEGRFGQDVEGVEELARWIREREPDAARVGVAIELKRGFIIAALIEKGFTVFSINPKQVDRFRDRFCVSGAKDDRRDAHALADSLRTDERAFRVIEPEHALIVELRQAVRSHEELKSDERVAANRLRDQLVRYYPAAVELANGDYCKLWFLELLSKVSSRQQALRTRESTVARILQAHRVRRVTAKAVLELLRRPMLPLAPGEAAASQRQVQMLVERLQLFVRQHAENLHHIDVLTQQIEQEPPAPGRECEQHDIAILHSLPGVGRIVLAVLLAEAHGLIAKRDYRGLRLLAGVAPVTERSGKRLTVSMRRACSPTLREAVHHWARVASTVDPHWKAVYRGVRNRNASASAAHAYRVVGNKLLQVAMAALRDGQPYQSQRWEVNSHAA
jgi:endonuclease III